MYVKAADDRRWWVGRRWLPWRPKYRDTDGGTNVSDAGNAGSSLDFDGDEPIGCVIALVIGLVLLAFPILFGLVLFVAEWLALLVVLPIITLLRVAWGMPWIVVARGPDGKRFGGQVRGWRASHQLIEQATSEIQMFGEPRSLERRR